FDIIVGGQGCAQVRGASPMKLFRRQFLHLAAGAAALPVLSRNASAQTYPTQSVRLIVGFPAGNASDILARLIAQSLSERLGQQFVVENRPGAGGNVGTEIVARALPDGYTLLLVLSSNAYSATLYVMHRSKKVPKRGVCCAFDYEDRRHHLSIRDAGYSGET